MKSFVWSILIVFPIVNWLAPDAAIWLTNEEPFIIGEATAKGISIAQRVGKYYQLITLSIPLLLIVYWCWNKYVSGWIEKNEFSRELAALQGITIGLIVFKVIGFEVNKCLFLCYFSLAILSLLGLLKKRNKCLNDSEVWVQWLAMTGISAMVFTSFYWTILFGVLLCFLWQWKGINTWVRGLHFSLITLPIVGFLGVESTLVLNQRGVFLTSYIPMTLIAFICVQLVIYLLLKRVQLQNQLYNWFVPMVILSIGILTVYEPVTERSMDVFELANGFNPLTRFSQYHQIPLLDNLSAHLLSDFFWQFVYTALNGFQADTSAMCYYGFTGIIGWMIIYFFLKEVIGNHVGLLVILLLCPVIGFIVPGYYSFALLPIWQFYRYVKNPVSKRLWSFVAALIFTVFWRLDLGVSLVAVTVLILPLWWYFNPSFRKNVLQTSAVVIGIGGGLGVLFYVYYPVEFQLAKHYFGANQAHGLSRVTNIESIQYLIDYLIIPGVIVAILAHTLILLKRLNNPTHWLILVLCGFYLFNLQRGLVRHSFVEQNETQILSFSLLIIALFSWDQLRNKQQHYTYWSLVIGLPVLLTIHEPGAMRSFLQFDVKTHISKLPELKKERLQREIVSADFQNKYGEIIHFLTNELKQEESFIDFSNTPMLYHYSGKCVPAYYNQFLQNTVDVRSQELVIQGFKNKQLPLVVFSQNPTSFFDQTDGIPNEVRYHKVTQYLYQHYEPFCMKGGFILFRMKGKSTRFPKDTALVLPSENWNLGYLPYYWKPENKQPALKRTKDKVVYHSTKVGYEIELPTGKTAAHLLTLQLESKTHQPVLLKAGEEQINFDVVSGEKTYRIPVYTSWKIAHSQNKVVTVETMNPLEIKGVWLEK